MQFWEQLVNFRTLYQTKKAPYYILDMVKNKDFVKSFTISSLLILFKWGTGCTLLELIIRGQFVPIKGLNCTIFSYGSFGE